VLRLPDASHWAMVDAPDAVARALIAHFTAAETAPQP